MINDSNSDRGLSHAHTMNTLGLIKQCHDIMNCRISYIFQQTDRQSNYHNDTERQLDPAPLACLLNCTNR